MFQLRTGLEIRDDKYIGLAVWQSLARWQFNFRGGRKQSRLSPIIMMPIVSDCSDPLPPKDKYQLLEEEYHRIRDELTQARATIEKYDRELGRRNQELREASQYIDNLQKVSQRLYQRFTKLDQRSLTFIRNLTRILFLTF